MRFVHNFFIAVIILLLTKALGVAALAGDINGDGTVNSLDWSLMNAQWFTSGPEADLNGDGIVNSIDFSIMNQNWGKMEGEADGIVFQWPSNSSIGSQGQDYGHYNWGKMGHYHTGLDIAGTNVVAAADGFVEKIFPCSYANCYFDGDPTSDNHVMQNVVVLKHALSSVRVIYSIYAHLGSIDSGLAVGQSITAGSPVGTTGVWCYRCKGEEHPNGRQLNHVHFEIKETAVLHNPLGGDVCQYGTGPGPCWGYTPNRPDEFGYHDPVTFFHNLEEYADAIPIRISKNDIRIRMGPLGSQNRYPVLTVANAGQEASIQGSATFGHPKQLPHACTESKTK